MIFSEDPNLLHELSYLLILSRAGEFFGKKGWRRVYALGFEYKGKGILVLLPQRGGKTTLGLDLLKNPDIRLLSDGTPLVDKTLRILPFPARIGVEKLNGEEIPGKFLYNIKRRKYGSKKLIDIEYFKNKAANKTVPLNLVLVGKRNLSALPKIVAITKARVFFALSKNLLLGLGIPQMAEFFLRWDIKDMVAKFRIFVSRLLRVIQLTARIESAKFVIGKNVQKNERALVSYILQKGTGTF